MKKLLVLIFFALFYAAIHADEVKDKSPLPSADEIKAAMATVKDVFKDEYKNLKTPRTVLNLLKSFSDRRQIRQTTRQWPMC